VVGAANLEEYNDRVDHGMDLHAILEAWEELALPQLPGVVVEELTALLRFLEACAIVWIGE
jgi:hypothetical protein